MSEQTSTLSGMKIASESPLAILSHFFRITPCDSVALRVLFQTVGEQRSSPPLRPLGVRFSSSKRGDTCSCYFKR